jgi:hypothetical protein
MFHVEHFWGECYEAARELSGGEVGVCGNCVIGDGGWGGRGGKLCTAGLAG